MSSLAMAESKRTFLVVAQASFVEMDTHPVASRFWPQNQNQDQPEQWAEDEGEKEPATSGTTATVGGSSDDEGQHNPAECEQAVSHRRTAVVISLQYEPDWNQPEGH
jgi:hypothetical protein